MVCLYQFFKGFLPEILLGPFLNTLTHLYVDISNRLKEIINILVDKKFIVL